MGYLRSDVPVGHADFGKLSICVCRQQEVDARSRERLYALSNLDELKYLTFDTFKPRGRIGLGPFQADSIEKAFNQSHHFSGSQQGWLLLQGRYGCGKTHLAAAIANRAAELGVPALFITVPDLLDQLRYAYSDPEMTFEQRFETIRRSPLLILDDFGTQNATEWAEEKLFQIVNYRYTNRLPMVITSNLVLDDIEPRIRSRLRDPDLVTHVVIHSPDYRRPSDDTGHHELSSLHLLNNRTFGNFDERRGEKLPTAEQRSLSRAFQAAQQFAQHPQGWLVFVGTYGSGKTHLAASIGNFRAGLGFPPLLIMVPELLDSLRETFSSGSRVGYNRRFDDVKTAPLLILDDLGTQSMTPWVREKLNQLFNYRYVAELPTIITMAESVEDLYRSEPRIATRMLDKKICRIYAITVPPYGGFARNKG